MNSPSSRSALSLAAPPRRLPFRKCASGGSPQARSPSSSWPITRPRCSPRARRRRRQSLRRAPAGGRGPALGPRGGRGTAIGQRVVGPLGLDPNLVGPSTSGKLDLFPERRTSLEVIHQKLGGGERVLA